eukprot:6214602-Pleurochrysis_carterae.AAC.1
MSPYAYYWSPQYGRPSMGPPPGGKYDGQIDNEDDVYIVEQIDTVRQRKGHWEYRVIWKVYPDPT